MLRLAKAEDWHAQHIDANVREADRRELWDYAALTPLATMRMGMERSSAHVALMDDEPISMFGVSPYSMLSGIGNPWMVGAKALETRAGWRAIALIAPDCFEHYKHRFPKLLYNLVDERNTVAIRWLERLGFTMGRTFPVGSSQLPFRVFYWRGG